MLFADWMLNLLIMGVIKTALPGKANKFLKDARNDVMIPLRMIPETLERETRSIAKHNSTYQQSSDGFPVKSNHVLNLKGGSKSLDQFDNIIPSLSPEMLASRFSANLTHGFLQGSQTRLVRHQTTRDSFAAGDGAKPSLWQDSTINETLSESGISQNGAEKEKGPYTSSVSSEEISTVTLTPMPSSTITPLEDFFLSWEAILIVAVAAICISCQFILCMMTRTRLRYVTCCERTLTLFELHKEDDGSLHSEDDDREGRKRKISRTSWTSDHLKMIDYFDYLSETKNVDDVESADSSRRPSNDTLGSKSPKEGLKGLKGLFRQQSVDSQDSLSGDNERRQSGDSLGDGPVSILRTSSGDSLDKRPVDILRSSRDGQAQRPRRKRKVSIDTSRRSSSDSLDGRTVDFSSRSMYDYYSRQASGESFDGGLRGILRRSSGDSYFRRPLGDSLGDGPVGILRRSSGDSYYRRPSGDSLGDGPMGILRRASGDSLDGLPAWLPRNKSGDSVKWKSSDVAHISEVGEGDLHVEDSPGSSNDSTEGYLSDQSVPNLKNLVPPKIRISMEYKGPFRLLESIVEIHDEVTRSPSGSCCEPHQPHSAGLKIDRL